MPSPVSQPMNKSVNLVPLSSQFLGFFGLDSQKLFFLSIFQGAQLPVALPRSGLSPHLVCARGVNFVLRVNKCITFGVKKYATRSIQFQTKLLLENNFFFLSQIVNLLNTLVVSSFLMLVMKCTSQSHFLSSPLS